MVGATHRITTNTRIGTQQSGGHVMPDTFDCKSLSFGGIARNRGGGITWNLAHLAHSRRYMESKPYTTTLGHNVHNTVTLGL